MTEKMIIYLIVFYVLIAIVAFWEAATTGDRRQWPWCLYYICAAGLVFATLWLGRMAK